MLLPETRQPAVVSTYTRQLQAGLKVLVRLGSAKTIIDARSLPHLRGTSETFIDAKSEEIAILAATSMPWRAMTANGRSASSPSYLRSD